jgi:two-component system phosphate regulon sensor histidine kinase PhoR
LAVTKSQVKLTAAMAALVVFAVLVWGVVAERGLRRAELERVARSLEERAALVTELARGVPFRLEGRAHLDAIADRAGQAASARVTLIAPDGTVVGDSNVPVANLERVANHADRPEVSAALSGRIGSSTRRSATVGRELYYLAAPVADGGVVRVAVDLSHLDAAVSRLRWELTTAGAIGLALALALSWAFSWFTLRPLREMRRVAASIANGRIDDRLHFGSGDELSDIASAINTMAEQLRLRLGDVTREKEQLRAVLEGMVEGVLVVDARGVVLLANSRMRELYEIGGEIVGRPLLESVRDAELDAIFEEAASGDENVARVVSAGRRAPRSLRVQAVRFPPGSGPRVGTVAVFNDITELMRLEEVRRDFVANASHELRTPLSAIQGFSETLLESDSLSPEEQKSYLEIIDRHARRLSNIVHDLLELSTIESRKTKLQPALVDVGELAASFVRDSEARYRELGVQVSVRDESTARAWADPGAVDQILTNLVDNAVKYTDPGGSVDVSIEDHANRLRVRVRDSGIGIPEADLSRIFERFYRVDKARSRALGGTGLGLSIVKHLVQSMGGEIYVESRLDEGSTFTFTLPLGDGKL